MTNNENQASGPSSNSNLPLIALILAFVFPLAGIIVSLLAKKEMKDSSVDKQTADRVQLAFILSIVFFAIQVIALAFWINAYFEAMNSLNQYQDDMNNYFDNLDTPEVCYDPYTDSYTEEACY